MADMEYKGYKARIEFDAHDRIFVGHIAGINDIVGFHGASVSELEQAFYESVDEYLAHCQKTGKAPNKPYSGRIMLRVPPELHADMAAHAAASGKSLNQWLIERVANQA